MLSSSSPLVLITWRIKGGSGCRNEMEMQYPLLLCRTTLLALTNLLLLEHWLDFPPSPGFPLSSFSLGNAPWRPSVHLLSPSIAPLFVPHAYQRRPSMIVDKQVQVVRTRPSRRFSSLLSNSAGCADDESRAAPTATPSDRRTTRRRRLR